MYRLYVDEVGTDDVGSVEADNERYLSLTGVAMRIIEARDNLTPRLDALKADIFDHDPDDPIILHRKKIMKENGPFGCLRDPALRARFDVHTMGAMADCEYRVISALIDKKAMLRKLAWVNKEPYHYLMEVLVEKYVQFLERHNTIGDVMPEGRLGKKDERLQAAYMRVRGDGTYYVPQARIRDRVPSANLKFRYKKNNIAGLQLADLLAHPSHMIFRERMGHEVTLGTFYGGVKDLLLASKYDRSSTGKITGYGMKWLP
ncbi:MAG TPA: DUF3800 domain-containing protein [Sphingomicrobium sp.]|nr:DUF3800 domain-containing protein [Sphingomicrobium sp.]